MTAHRFAHRLSLTALLAAALFLGSHPAPADAAGKVLIIKGSDTMVNLMSNLAEAYMKLHSDVDIAVTGGGSGTGIAALLNSTTDICASSRQMKDNELEQAHAKKLDPQTTVIGLDGIAIMVNPGNPVSELSLEQLKKIYTGEYTRWSELGGPDQPILVLSRESNSGTYVYFQEHVLEKADFSPKVRLMPSTAAIAQSVTEDRWAIGYGGVAYAEHAAVKVAKVKQTADSPSVAPSEATVHDGSYPISRPLYLYTNGAPAGTAQAFIEFCLSAAGQGIVTETGYITVKK
jgi:phosphate transport system substrate-binding protein